MIEVPCSCSRYRMHRQYMTIKEQNDALEARLWRGQELMAAGGILGALAASSCCVLPLLFFSLGVSGAWIGNFTQLAPYQPYFVAVTLLCLGCGYWSVYRSGTRACAEGGGLHAACAKSRRQGKPHPFNDPRRRRAWPRFYRSPFSKLMIGKCL